MKKNNIGENISSMAVAIEVMKIFINRKKENENNGVMLIS